MVWPTPSVKIELDRTRRMRLTFRAMRTFEDITGKSLLVSSTWTTMMHEEVWALLWVCLLAGDPALTMDAVGDWVGPSDLPYLYERIDATCREAMPPPVPRSGDDEDDEGQSGEPPDWLTFWTIGRVDLKLTDSGFLDLTPREFGALLDRRRKIRDEDTDRADLRAGIIASTVFNMLKSEKETARAPKDFMPQRVPVKKPQQTDEHMLAVVRVLNAAYGGEVVEVYD